MEECRSVVPPNMCCLSFSGNTTACLISSSSTTTTAADAEEKEKKEAFKNRVNEHINKVDTKGDDKDDLGLKAAEEEAEGSAETEQQQNNKKKDKEYTHGQSWLTIWCSTRKRTSKWSKLFAIVEIFCNCVNC